MPLGMTKKSLASPRRAPGVRVKEKGGHPTALPDLGVGGTLLLQQHHLLLLLALGSLALLLLTCQNQRGSRDPSCFQGFTVQIWAKKQNTDGKTLNAPAF